MCASCREESGEQEGINLTPGAKIMESFHSLLCITHIYQMRQQGQNDKERIYTYGRKWLPCCNYSQKNYYLLLAGGRSQAFIKESPRGDIPTGKILEFTD